MTDTTIETIKILNDGLQIQVDVLKQTVQQLEKKVEELESKLNTYNRQSIAQKLFPLKTLTSIPASSKPEPYRIPWG